MGCERCGYFWNGFWDKIRHQIWCLMSCGWVIGYICVSLYYVSLQVNKIRSIFQIWVGGECKMFGFVMWILMGSVRGWFLDDRIAGNAWFLLGEMGICKEIFWIFYEDFLRKFCDFWSSSIEALFYKGWEDFWRYFWWFLAILKWRKTLIFQGFVELGIELKIGVKVWEHQICPFRQSNICSKM